MAFLSPVDYIFFFLLLVIAEMQGLKDFYAIHSAIMSKVAGERPIQMVTVEGALMHHFYTQNTNVLVQNFYGFMFGCT